jgi:ribosomal protein S12 methylthiotransferase
MNRAPRISFVSLGCPKALVDSERIVTRLRAEGYELAREHADADLAIVNTCGFLDSAQAESLAAIGAALAENGKVVVTGCMGAQPEQITAAYPNVLAVTGPQQYESVLAAVHRAAPPPHDPYVELIPPQGIKLTPRHYAYLKISEGCNNRCTFCIIPKLRGGLASRAAADVLREAERLVDAGVKELLVISQDTSAYGTDLKYAASEWKGRAVRAKFLDLARELGEFGVWVRLHYVYPYPHVDEVIALMADGKVLPYLDVPFQHASPAVLKRMRRPAAQEETLERIRRWRAACPGLTIRSTFIVGFPGETEEDFSALIDWLGAAELDRVGCFRYEPVAGAAANDLAAPVPEPLKAERQDRLMQRQQEISRRRLKRRIGARERVIIDEVEPARGGKRGAAKGRSKGDAPQIDGTVYVQSRRPLRVGEIATVKIERADAYDLYGTAVGY